MKTFAEIHQSIQSALERARQTHEYRAEGASIEFTGKLIARMEELKMTRSELARSIGVKPAYITKILRGDTNFSLDTMVKIAHALGCEYRAHLQPQGARTHWVDLYTTKSKESFTMPALEKQKVPQIAFRVLPNHVNQVTEDEANTTAA